MELSSFEEAIDPVILDRGKIYYQDGLVKELEEEGSGAYTAVVSGTDQYQIMLRLKGNTVRNWQCSCPYDFGPVCKHVVAVLYALRKEKAEEAGSKKKKKPTKKEQLNQIFSKVKKAELQAFIEQLFAYDSSLKQVFLTYFADRLAAGQETKYRNLVKQIHRSFVGRHDFIDYQSARGLAHQLDLLLKKGEELLAQGNLTETWALCQSLMEELPLIVAHADDSSGFITDTMTYAISLAARLTEVASPELRDQVFDFCLQEMPKEKYRDFGLEAYFLDLIPLTITSRKQEEKFIHWIDSQLAKADQSFYGEYDRRRLIGVKARYFEHSGQQQRARELWQAYQHYPEFAEKLIEEALVKKQFAEARSLCEAAQEQKDARYRQNWSVMLIRIAEEEGDRAALQKALEQAYLLDPLSSELLKKLTASFAQDEWETKQAELEKALLQKSSNKGVINWAQPLAIFYAQTGESEKLLQLLETAADITLTDHYIASLAKKFPKEALQLYQSKIEDFSEQTGRSYYNQLARYLKKMRKLPEGEAQVRQMVTALRSRYKQRKALLEVLQQHFPDL